MAQESRFQSSETFNGSNTEILREPAAEQNTVAAEGTPQEPSRFWERTSPILAAEVTVVLPHVPESA